MPLYEYVCPSCEAKFEKLRPMANGHRAECPSCGMESPRVLSVFAAFSRGSEGETVSVAGAGCAGACPAGCT